MFPALPYATVTSHSISYFQCWFTCKSFFGNNSNSATVKYTELFIELMCNFCLLAWLNWSAMKRRIVIGSLSDPNFAIRTAYELISANFFFFQLIAKNKQFFGQQKSFYLHQCLEGNSVNVHKSDAGENRKLFMPE